MPLSFQDRANTPTGRFRLRVCRDGRLVELVDEPNLIVSGYAAIHAHCVAGVASYAVTQIGVGTGGSAPAASNTALISPVLKPFDSVAYPAANQAQFNFSFGTGDANGTAIAEFGLITASGLLYARKTRSTVLNKTSSITLSGSWTISF